MIKVVQWPDLHCPHEDQEAVCAVMEFCRVWKPDMHIILGDALNLSGISSHVQDDLIEQNEDKTADGLISFGRIIDEIFKITPNAEVVWTWGNHDERLLRFVRKHPSWKGILDKPLELLEFFGKCKNAQRVRIVQMSDNEEEFRVGKMSFVHGHYTGKHCAAQHVEAYGESITFGHTHTMQLFTTVRRGRPIAGFTPGHLMNKNGRKYLKGRPTRWVTGFAFMETDKESGSYTQHLIPIVDGMFNFAGRRYGGHEKVGGKNGKGGGGCLGDRTK